MNELTKKHLLSKGFFETDENQMVKKLSETKFHVYDEVEYPHATYAFNNVIDLNNYTEEQLEREVKGYYTSIKHIRECYGEESNQAIAEIMAQESNHDEFVSFATKTENRERNSKPGLAAMKLYRRNGYGHISKVDGRSYDIARMSELVSNKDHDVTVVIFYGEGQPLEIIDFYYGEYDFFDTENVIIEYYRNKKKF